MHRSSSLGSLSLLHRKSPVFHIPKRSSNPTFGIQSDTITAMPSTLIKHLLVDFDQTLTVRDTLATLVSASPLAGADSIFRGLTEAYVDDYSAHAKAYHPPRNERRSIASEFHFLAGLREVERRSIHRVEASNIFKGVTQESLAEAARQVEVRKPQEFVSILSHAERVSIVSVNWSSVFIREVLESMDCNEGHPGCSKSLTSTISATTSTSKTPLPIANLFGRKVEIYANNLITDHNGLTTGKLDRWFHHQHHLDGDVDGKTAEGGRRGEEGHGIWTADDKLRILEDILGQTAGSGSNLERVVTTATSEVDSNDSSSPVKNARDADTTERTDTLALDTAVERPASEQINEMLQEQCPMSTTMSRRNPTAAAAGPTGYKTEYEEGEGYNVYVGDSPTDFAALLLCKKVQVGFVMGGEGENGPLLEVCERTGVRVLTKNIKERVCEESEDRDEDDEECGDADKCDAEGMGETVDQIGFDSFRRADDDLRVLYKVEGWDEIVECLRHPDRWGDLRQRIPAQG